MKKHKRKKRLWETKVVHCQKEPYDILIDRTTPFGNPYSHQDDTLAQFKVATRKEAMDGFRAYLESNKELQEKIKPLKGKTLGCWCRPEKTCHGDIIAEFLHRLDPTEESLLQSIFGIPEED